MAGDWLKVECDTPEKPEVLAIAARLAIDPENVFAKCFKVWRWAQAHTTDGFARGVTRDMIDAIAGLPNFSQALSAVGWLEARSDGIRLPNFGQHMGQGAKARAQTANRMRLSRLRKSDGPPVTDASPEKRREEKSKGEEPPLPPSLDSPEFRKSWEDWLAFRAERRPQVTPLAAKRQLARLAKMGPARAVAAIENSIANSYQGIFEPREVFGGNGPGGGVGHDSSRVRATAGKYDGRADFGSESAGAAPGARSPAPAQSVPVGGGAASGGA